ncbi:MAG: FAD-dependent oxidoreductase [Ardenticatenaceae bacterium]|nr:FAD-dependent oxidoreductase [Ardenticatenaceae bacterium]
MTNDYDLVVIGAGAAGSTAASTAAESGHRVALVERDRLGGTCLNYGCDPTKTLLHVAQRLFHARHGSRYGLRIAAAEADWTAVHTWVGQVLDRIRGGTRIEAHRHIAATGIDLYWAEARFGSPHEVIVGTQTLRAARIIIATGGEARVPPIDGLREVGFLTNIEAVSLAPLPRRLAIVGGGPIGVEFAQLFHRFGVAVTVLEMADHILPKDDRELIDRLAGLLVDEGVRLRTSVAHIWAAGDVTGGYQFTHVAAEQGQLAAHNAFASRPTSFDDRVVPWVTYTDPALAHVGQTEEQLREAGVRYRVARLALNELDRAITTGETDGLVKLLADEEGQLLGGQILAPNAGDLIAPVVLAMHARLPVKVLAETILPYPTMAEGVRWAADKLVGE